jgi:hypothetical protein
MVFSLLQRKTLNASIPFGLPARFQKASMRSDSLCRGVGIDDQKNQVLKGYLVVALALRGDEGRGTLR